VSELCITIPGLPPIEASPNDRTPWWAKSPTLREYKETVTMLGNLERSKAHWTVPEMAHVHVTFVLPDCRRRDRDNLIARAKPLIDALGPFREVRNRKGKVISAYGCDIIKDDDPRHADITYELAHEKGVSKVVVEVA
jgi:hypothetical protein